MQPEPYPAILGLVVPSSAEVLLIPNLAADSLMSPQSKCLHRSRPGVDNLV